MSTVIHSLNEMVKSLYVGRRRKPYDDHARMVDIIRKNCTPYVPRHAKAVS